MKPCCICRTPIKPFISFGRMPIANGFLAPDEFANEHFYNLGAGFCSKCHMVQLTELVAPGKLFHEQYAFCSSTSTRMVEHFQRFAEEVCATHLLVSLRVGRVTPCAPSRDSAKPGAHGVTRPTSSTGTKDDPFVVEIGSNDGVMLQHFAKAGIRHLGIEPSANVAEVARGKGVQTICDFFGEALARRIVSEHGKADAFLGANVMCHIADLNSVVAGVKLLLKPRGALIFEDPYLGDIIEKTAYDQIYDEHACYFSVASLDYLFAEHDMEIVDLSPQPVHGGSLRYTVAHRGAMPVSAAVAAQRDKEKTLGLDQPATYDQFRRNVEKSRDELMTLLRRLKAEGKRVVGYAATSKSTTVTNYCGITPDLVEFISDTTPIKQGKYSPGAHIPVRPYSEFTAHYPDYALLFGWNHGEEIMAKEKSFTSSGGKWIVYVPRVMVLG
jgi:methylation protein EvaC